MGLVDENKKRWKLSDFELLDILGLPLKFDFFQLIIISLLSHSQTNRSEFIRDWNFWAGTSGKGQSKW